MHTAIAMGLMWGLVAVVAVAVILLVVFAMHFLLVMSIIWGVSGLLVIAAIFLCRGSGMAV
jgi:hypothetical protein